MLLRWRGGPGGQCLPHSITFIIDRSASALCTAWVCVAVGKLFSMCACVVHAAMLSGACTATFSVYWMMLSLMLSDTSTGPDNCLIAGMCHVVPHAL